MCEHKEQDWAEVGREAWLNCNESFSPFHGKLWNWCGPSKLCSFRQEGQVFIPTGRDAAWPLENLAEEQFYLTRGNFLSKGVECTPPSCSGLWLAHHTVLTDKMAQHLRVSRDSKPFLPLGPKRQGRQGDWNLAGSVTTGEGHSTGTVIFHGEHSHHRLAERALR